MYLGFGGATVTGAMTAGNFAILTATGIQDLGYTPALSSQPVNFSGNGAASTPGLQVTGTWFTGGSATTTKPMLLVEPAGTTSTAWSTSGTGIGINAASGFVGQLIDFKVNNQSQVNFNANTTAFQAAYASGYGGQIRYNGITTRSTGWIGWTSTDDAAATIDTFMMRAAAASIRFGAGDAASPIAQTTKVQGVVAGTSNVAGALWTLAGSVGTGTGRGGDVLVRVAPPGTTGTAQNALTDALRVYGEGDVSIGTGAAIATNATAGFLLLPTCAGTPTGTPTNTGAGKANFVYDSTANKLWVYNGSWRGVAVA